MQITTRESYEVLVVDVQGKLDNSTSAEAYDELVRIAKSGEKKVLVNLKGVDYISSAGLRALLVAAKLVNASGGRLKLCEPTDSVKQLLDWSSLDSLLSVYATEGEAIKSF